MFRRISLRALDSLIAGAKTIDRRFSSVSVQGPELYDIDRASIREILVFKPDEIGDAVCSLPALRLLRESFPASRITLICQDKVAVVYERSGLVDRAIPVCVTTRFLRFVSFDWQKALKETGVEQFDLSLFLRTYPAYFSQFKKFPAAIQIHPRHRWMKPDSAYQVSLGDPHGRAQTEQLLDLVRAVVGKKAAPSFPSFQWSEEEKTTLARFEIPPQYIVVHPYNKYETKRYPYWDELLKNVQLEFKLPLIVIGGSEDADLGLPGVFSLQGKLKLGQTGFLIQNAKAFIGNESGPGHWASALGVPTVTLMGGHSSEKEWAASGDALTLKADVPCASCHRRVCPGKGLICFTELSPKEVWPSIRSYLTSRLNR